MSEVSQPRFLLTIAFTALGGIVTLVIAIFGIGGLLIFGVSNSSSDNFYVLGAFVPFLMVLGSLFSLRGCVLAMWAWNALSWVVSFAMSLPILNFNPANGTMSVLDLIATAMITLAYAAATFKSGVGRKHPWRLGLIHLVRTSS